jgi:hypothetical protein
LINLPLKNGAFRSQPLQGELLGGSGKRFKPTGFLGYHHAFEVKRLEL